MWRGREGEREREREREREFKEIKIDTTDVKGNRDLLEPR